MVDISRTGGTLTVRVVTDISAIIADGTLNARQKRREAFRQVVRELADAAEADSRTDAEIDAEAAAQVAYATAEANRLKGLRPAGNL